VKIRSTKNFDHAMEVIVRCDRRLGNEIKDVIRELVEGGNVEGLRLHRLKGDLKMYWSVSVNSDLRIVYYCQSDVITLVDVGSHKEVYEEN